MRYLALLSVFVVLLCAHVTGANSNAPSNPTAAASMASRQEPHMYEIVGEEVVYSRWRTVIQRQVRYPKGNIVDFDVSGRCLVYLVFLLLLAQRTMFHL